jgi:sec-independent protein translocase protein TatA
MNIASLFNLAGPDLIIILFIVVLLFGANKLPELLRGMVQALREFIRAKGELAEAMSERPTSPGTAFGLAAVVVALICFLLVIGARWAGP